MYQLNRRMQRISKSVTKPCALTGFFLLVLLITGCNTIYNNNLLVQTGVRKYTSGDGNVVAPLGLQPVAGQWVQDIPLGNANNTAGVAPFGSIEIFQGVTSPNTSSYQLAALLTEQWPTEYFVGNMRMPAYWDFAWKHPSYCLDNSDPLNVKLLSNPFYTTDTIVNPTSGVFFVPRPPAFVFYCDINSPAKPDFSPSDLSQQFALDDQLPASLQVSAFSPINAPSSITNLRVYSPNLTNTANSTASIVSSSGNYAIFPFPKLSNGSDLPAGAYIMTITTDPGSNTQTTNGMEPFYVGHNDHSFTSAFGVDEAAPMETITTSTAFLPHCQGGTTKSTVGGTPLPVVTLPRLGELAVGSMSDLIPVGTTPTVVIAFDRVIVNTTVTSGTCSTITTVAFTGAQAALVVNTGSNNVSIVGIGQEYVPTATIAVGNQPVAAVVNSSETFAYIANYGDGTITEINLKTLQASRVLNVNPHPTSIAFDYDESLWVGGQGYMQLVDPASWSVQSTFSIDGTVNGMSYDTSTGNFIMNILKNGSTSQPQATITQTNNIEYSATTGSSYSTPALFNVATGRVTGYTTLVDAASYTQSSANRYATFTAQTAFNPPVYSSPAGDLFAVANGDTITVYDLNSGNILIQGNMPFPVRGIKLTNSMLYVTMPDSNSLVTLPLQLPNTVQLP